MTIKNALTKIVFGTLVLGSIGCTHYPIYNIDHRQVIRPEDKQEAQEWITNIMQGNNKYILLSDCKDAYKVLVQCEKTAIAMFGKTTEGLETLTNHNEWIFIQYGELNSEQKSIFEKLKSKTHD